MLAAGQSQRIEALFESVAVDSRVVAVAFCKADDERAISSKLMPSSLPCEAIARGATEIFSSLQANGRDMLIASFPLSTREIDGHFVIVHDLTFSERRGNEARNFVSILLGSIVLLSGATAVALVLFLTRRWMRSFRRALFNVTRNAEGDEVAGSGGVLDRELQLVLRQLKAGRAAVDSETVEWNKNTLRTIMEAELPGVEVLVVANREPYIHNFGNDGVELQTPASGLVSAVEPIMRACRGTWIAHGSGTADRETVDQNDRIAVPPDGPEYTLRRIWITEAEQDGYYYGLANEGLWPLCHIAFTRPTFRLSDWETYRAVNHRFADAVVREARTDCPIVLVQDYHFALLPRMLQGAVAKCDDHRVLAYPVAELGNVRHLSVEGRTHSWAARQHDHRISYAVSLQQFSGNRRSLRRKPDRPGARSRCPGWPRDIRETLPDFDRVAARRP